MRYLSVPMFAVLIMIMLPASPAVAQDQSLVEKGKQVFADQKCRLCHSIEGKGNKKGALDEIGSKLHPDEIRAWIVSEKEMRAKTNAKRKPEMKDYSSLPPDEVDALVAYLLTRTGS